MMVTTIWGIVKDGRVLPESPLPEGAQVEIRLYDVRDQGSRHICRKS